MPIRLRRIAKLLSLGVALAVLALLTSVVPANAVYLGHDAPFEKYRFMVSLRTTDEPDRHRCGGTLIEPDIVLTAAHCVDGDPQGGHLAVVGADVPDWPAAQRVPTSGYRVPDTYDADGPDNRDDIAVLRLTVPQSTPTIRLARAEPDVGDRTGIAGWGCTNAPPVCEVEPTTLQAAGQVVIPDPECGIDVFWMPAYHPPTTLCTKGIRPNATVNRGDSGGPLLVAGRHDVRQVGVTSLGADSTTKRYAGFTSIPVEADWLADAIESLHAS